MENRMGMIVLGIEGIIEYMGDRKQELLEEYIPSKSREGQTDEVIKAIKDIDTIDSNVDKWKKVLEKVKEIPALELPVRYAIDIDTDTAQLGVATKGTEGEQKENPKECIDGQLSFGDDLDIYGEGENKAVEWTIEKGSIHIRVNYTKSSEVRRIPIPKFCEVVDAIIETTASSKCSVKQKDIRQKLKASGDVYTEGLVKFVVRLLKSEGILQDNGNLLKLDRTPEDARAWMVHNVLEADVAVEDRHFYSEYIQRGE